MHRLKQRINDYWSERAPSFQKQRWHELCSDKKDRWYAEFRRYIPNDRTLRILDLGTGTGFFAFLLAQEGHQVTGIDLSEEMILRARSCAENLDVQADFAVSKIFQYRYFRIISRRTISSARLRMLFIRPTQYS